ncbi:MAG: SWIM zinc finger family protein [Gallionella sp.]|nr:SWIM zinc finger family protein [Gallionella sp.]
MKLRLESFTTQGAWYDVDKGAATCTCPAFDANLHCKHLEAVGVYKQHKATLSARPNYSQALSALVKSIRLRDIEEGAYWLTYCWGFKDKLSGSQFRTVRRLLIGSAEDGHSIAVMEKLAENFPALLNKQVEFERVMAELVRICKVPNWWNPATGGHDYIHCGMLAMRKTFYAPQSCSIGHCLNSMEQAINDQSKVAAMFWMMKADESGKGAGLHIAQHLLAIATRHHHAPAQRLMQNVYLRHAKSLSDDGNFIGQAVWLLAGGTSTVIDQIEPVTRGEVRRLIERVNDTQSYPPPEWCCDGVHCAGNDIRYAGMWDRMYAACNQFNRYQQVLPSDEWLEDQFYSLEGLRTCT